jgi:hypothetical protein
VPITLSPDPQVKLSETATIGFLTTVLDALDGDRTSRVAPVVRHPEEAGPVPLRVDIVEEWGMQSFPASDPPANW